MPGSNGTSSWTPPNVALVADGAGGAVVIWTNISSAGTNGNLQAQRLNAAGTALWAQNGVTIAPKPSSLQTNPRAVNDGAGGVIVAWTEPYYVTAPKVYAQRIDNNGNPLWAADGVAVSAASSHQGQTGIGIAPDGSGGALLVWQDTGAAGTQFFAQRLDANGNALWGADGAQLTNFPLLSPPGTDEPLILDDGSGGALISYSSTPAVGGQSNPQAFQHVDSSGKSTIAGGGVNIAGIAQESRMIPDNAGGAIIVGDCSETLGICAQRLDANGNPLWGLQPIRLMSNYGFAPEVASDGSGGIFITWEDWRDRQPNAAPSVWTDDVYVQHINASGLATWQPNGVFVSVMNQPTVPVQGPLPRVVSDGSGGVIVSWMDCWHYDSQNACYASLDMYARRFDGNGNPLWTTSEIGAGLRTTGIVVSAAPGNQGEPFVSPSRPMYAMVSDTKHGAILAWPDGRNRVCDIYTGCDIYAQRASDQFPLDFSLTVATAAQTVKPGQSAQYTVSLATTNGALAAPVTFSCSGLPSGASCVFSPSTIASGTSSISDSVTISTTPSSICTANLGPALPTNWGRILWTLAFAVVFFFLHRQRVSWTMSSALLAMLCVVLTSCGGGNSATNSLNSNCTANLGTPAGTYVVTITGTQGSLTHSVTVSLTVQ